MELERKKNILIRAGYYGLWGAAACLLLRYVWILILPLLCGFFIAYLLRPAAHFICRHSGMSRRAASIVSAVVFYLLIIIIIWLACTLFALRLSEITGGMADSYEASLRPALREFNTRMAGFLQRLAPQLGADTDQLFETIEEGVKSILVTASSWGLEQLGQMLRSAPVLLLTVIVTILSSVLICADYETVTGFVLRQIPQRHHKLLSDIRIFLTRTLFHIGKAYLIISLITFGELCLGLWILRVPSFWAAAAFIALLDLLPVLGSGAVLIPWAVYRLVMQDYFTGIGLLVLWIALTLIRQFLEPKIVGNQLGLHPLVTLSAMYCGLRLAGFAGLVLAPIACLLLKYLQENKIWKLYR